MKSERNKASSRPLLEEIITEAKKSARSDNPSLGQILGAYDEFLQKKNISPNSELGTSLYRTLLKSSRLPGEDWDSKLDISIKQTEEDVQNTSLRTTENIFKKNLMGTLSQSTDKYFESLKNLFPEKENFNSEQLNSERQMNKILSPRTNQWSTWSKSWDKGAEQQLPQIVEHNNESSSNYLHSISSASSGKKKFEEPKVSFIKGDTNGNNNIPTATEESTLRSAKWITKALNVSTEAPYLNPFLGNNQSTGSRSSTPSKNIKDSGAKSMKEQFLLKTPPEREHNLVRIPTDINRVSNSKLPPRSGKDVQRELKIKEEVERRMDNMRKDRSKAEKDVNEILAEAHHNKQIKKKIWYGWKNHFEESYKQMLRRRMIELEINNRLVKKVFFLFADTTRTRARLRELKRLAIEHQSNNTLRKFFGILKNHATRKKEKAQFLEFRLASKNDEDQKKAFLAWKNFTKKVQRSRRNMLTANFVRDQRLLKLSMRSLKKLSFLQRAQKLAVIESRKKYKSRLMRRAFEGIKKNYEWKMQKLRAGTIANKIIKKISLRKFVKNLKLMKIGTEIKKRVDPVKVFNKIYKSKFFRRLQRFKANAKRHRCLLNASYRNRIFNLQKKFFSFWKYSICKREEIIENFMLGQLNKLRAKAFRGWLTIILRQKELLNRVKPATMWVLESLISARSICTEKENLKTTAFNATTNIPSSLPMSPSFQSPVNNDGALQNYGIRHFLSTSSDMSQLNRSLQGARGTTNRVMRTDALRVNTHNLLKIHYLNKYFVNWKEKAKIKKDFVKKVQRRKMKSILTSLHKFTSRRMCLRYCRDKISKKRISKILGCVFLAWINSNKRQRLENAAITKLTANHLRVIKKRTLNVMYREYMVANESRSQELKARDFFDFKISKTAFSRWLYFIRFQRKKSLALNQCYRNYSTKTLEKIFYIWNTFAQGSKRKKRLNKSTNKFYMSRKCTTVLTAWIIYKELAVEKNRKKLKAKEQRQKQLKTASWINFMTYFEKRKTKKMIRSQLLKNHTRRLLKKSLFVLKKYSNIKKSKRIRDKLLVPRLKAVKKQMVLFEWIKKTSNRKMITQMVSNLEMLRRKRFFLILGKWRGRIMEKTHQIRGRKAFHMKRAYFMQLKRYLQKKKIFKQMEILMRQNKEFQALQNSFSSWKRRYFYNKNSTYLYAYTIIFIKNSLQAKYFGGLKRCWENKKRLEYMTSVRCERTKRNCLLAWNFLADQKHKRENILTAYLKYRSFEIRKYVFYQWADKNFRAQKIKAVQNVLKKYMQHKFLSNWAEAYHQVTNSAVRLRPFRYFELLNKDSKFSQTLKPKNKRRERKMIEFYKSLTYIREKNLLKKTLVSWLLYLSNKKEEVYRFLTINKEINSRTKLTILDVWREKANERASKYKAASFLVLKLSSKLQAIGFASLLNHNVLQLELEDIEKESRYFHQMKLKKKGFEGLFLNKHKKEKELSKKAIANFVIKKRLFQLLLGALSTNALIRQNRRKKIEYVSGYYQSKQLLKTWKAWKDWQSRKSTLRASQAELVRARKAKYGFKLLKRMAEAVQTKKKNKVTNPMTERHYRRFMKIKGFLSWKIFLNKQRSQRGNNERASLNRRLNLLRKGFHSFYISKSARLKETQDRAALSRLIRERVSVFPLRKFFNQWRLNFEEAKNFEQDVSAIFQEQRVRKMLLKWRLISLEKVQKRTNASERIRLKQFLVKKTVFQTWRKSIGLKKVVNHVTLPKIREIKRLFFYHWRKSCNQMALIQAKSQERYLQSLIVIFSSWKDYFVKEKKIKFIIECFRKRRQLLITTEFFRIIRNSMKATLKRKHLNLERMDACFEALKKNYILRQKAKLYHLASNQNLAHACLSIWKFKLQRRMQIYEQLIKLNELISKRERDDLYSGFLHLKHRGDVKAVQAEKLGELFYIIEKRIKSKFMSNTKSFVESVMHRRKRKGELAVSVFKKKIKRDWKEAIEMWKKYSKNVEKLNKGLSAMAKLQKLAAGAVLLKNISCQSRFVRYLEKISLLHDRCRRVYLKRAFFYTLKDAFEQQIQLEEMEIEAGRYRRVRIIDSVMQRLKFYAKVRIWKKSQKALADQFHRKSHPKFEIRRYFEIMKSQVFQSPDSVLNRGALLKRLLLKLKKRTAFMVLQRNQHLRVKRKELLKEKESRFKDVLLMKLHEMKFKVFDEWKRLSLKQRLKNAKKSDKIKLAEAQHRRSLLKAGFNLLQSNYEFFQSKKSKSLLYSSFSSWRMYTKEKHLLKKYLKEADFDQALAYSPKTSQRNRLFESHIGRSPLSTGSLDRYELNETPVKEEEF